MRILYIHTTPIENRMANVLQVLSMCKAFADIGHDLFLLIPTLNENNLTEIEEFVHREYKITNNFAIKAPYVHSNRIAKYLSWFKIKRIMKEIKPDFCYVRDPLIMDLLVRNKFNTVFEVHSNAMHKGNIILDLYYRARLSKVAKLPYLNKVIAISNNLKNYWIDQGIEKNKIFAYHDGFDEKKFIDIKKAEARKYLNIPNDKKVVMYVGSLYANRKIEFIIDIIKEMPKVSFWIIGGPNEKADYVKREHVDGKLNNLIITGHITHDKVPFYLSAADVLLAFWSRSVSTIDYCSPLKLFEYMAAGRIILAHDFPTIREVIKDGFNGFLCEPESHEDAVTKLRLALTCNRSDSMANQAKVDAFNYYTWNIRAKKIIESLMK